MNFRNRIIAISGEPESKKSEVMRVLKEKYENLNYKVKISNIEEQLIKIGQERGLLIEDVQKKISLNEYVNSIVESINSKNRPNEIFIFDSTLACSESFSVRLNVGDSIQSFQNEDNYKLIIDTSYSTVEDIVEVIIKCLEYELQGESYTKTWTTPKKLLPVQAEWAIYKGGDKGYTFEQLKDIIKKEGYNPHEHIETISVDGRMYIVNGHHRNFVSGSLGKTLVPYVEYAKDDENLYDWKTARQFASWVDKESLQKHERFFDTPEHKFSYNEIYPGIYEELDRREKKAQQAGDR